MQTTVLALMLIAPGADPDFAAFDRRLADVEARVAALEGKTAPAKAATPCACPLTACTCGAACPCPVPAAVPTYPQYLVGGRWVGEAEFRRAYPAAAPFSADPAPTGSVCGPNGCPAPANTLRPAEGIPAFAPATGPACPGGNCPAPARYAPSRGLFRR